MGKSWTAAELNAFKKKKQFEATGIDRYHAAGYKGKGIVIINREDGTDHAEMTTQVLREVAPEATIINAAFNAKYTNGKVEDCYFRIDGQKYTPVEMYEKFKPDIMSVSFGNPRGVHPEREHAIEQVAIAPLVDRGLIVCNAAGNEGSAGVGALYGCVDITVGAIEFVSSDGYTKPRLTRYSSYGDVGDVDFVAFMGSMGSGTSAACPFLAGQIALIMQRYNLKGKANRKSMICHLRGCTVDMGDAGLDGKHGYGYVRLPEGELEVKDVFKDVEKDRWSWADIEFCAENSLLKGYEDGTFRPDKPVTREEFAAGLHRLCEKMEGR